MGERFAALADEFIARVQAAEIGPATEVVLVHHCVDQTGTPVGLVRISLAPTTRVTFPGDPELARQFAASAHRDTVIGNINSLVRDAPLGLLRLAGGPPYPVIIRDFTLEIIQPADESKGPGVAHPIEPSLRQDRTPLRVDRGGVIRVGPSRVSLDLVVEQYENGMTPEDMVRAYDTLQLADVYAAIAYYLRHRDEVRAYLRRREEEATAYRARIEGERPRVSRDELLARRALREEDHAPAGQ